MQLHLQVGDSCSSSHFQMYFGLPQAQHLVDGDQTQNCQAVFWCCSGWPQDLSAGFPISFGNGRCQVQLLSLQSVRFQEEPQRSRSSGAFWCMKAQAKWAHFRDFLWWEGSNSETELFPELAMGDFPCHLHLAEKKTPGCQVAIPPASAGNWPFCPVFTGVL